MKPIKSIQIQSVIYNNQKSSLLKAISALKNAMDTYKKLNCDIDATLVYGDASPERIFLDDDIKNIETMLDGTIHFNYIFFNFNSGTAKGHNIMGEQCTSDYMMIMNPDVIVTPQHFIEMLKLFDDETGIVEARQTPIEHAKDYDMATLETDWASTACAIFPTHIFNEVHGFDYKTFFLYCDDLDFSWRVRLLGYKIKYQPSAPVFHDKRLTNLAGWQPTSAERYYSAEAALFMAHKWSNPQRVMLLLKTFKESKDSYCIKAAAEYEKRLNANQLPSPIDADHKVAKFVGDKFEVSRF